MCHLPSTPESFVEEVEAEEQMETPEPKWEDFPTEVWQLVFQRVPLLDLVTSGRLVCRRWNDVISDESVSLCVHMQLLCSELCKLVKSNFTKLRNLSCLGTMCDGLSLPFARVDSGALLNKNYISS